MRQFWHLVITDLFDDLRSFIFAFLVRSQYILSMTRMAHPISISLHPRGRRSRSTRRERPRPPPRSPRAPCRKETASHAILPITKQTRLGGVCLGRRGHSGSEGGSVRSLLILQSGAARFCNMFSESSPGCCVLLYCSCHAALATDGNFQKTYHKTFGTSCRPRLWK